jgi:hypothetical protein
MVGNGSPAAIFAAKQKFGVKRSVAARRKQPSPALAAHLPNPSSAFGLGIFSKQKRLRTSFSIEVEMATHLSRTPKIEDVVEPVTQSQLFSAHALAHAISGSVGGNVAMLGE